MRALIAILLVTVTLSAQGVETDKAAHFGISYAATTLMYGLLKAPSGNNRLDAAFGAAAVVLVGGFVKEMIDDRADTRDLIANCVGIGSATVVTLAFEF